MNKQTNEYTSCLADIRAHLYYPGLQFALYSLQPSTSIPTRSSTHGESSASHSGACDTPVRPPAYLGDAAPQRTLRLLLRCGHLQ